MPTLHFLSAAMPLTKTFFLDAKGKVAKDPYPNAAFFTSHDVDVDTPSELFKAIKEHADKNHCLLKGTLLRDLKQESRKGTTLKDSQTQWICLDFDRYKTDSVDDALNLLGLDDVTYVVQWSSSHGTAGTAGTISCHVFMILTEPLPAPILKLWLQQKNLEHFSDQITLTRDSNGLRWPLDVTVCQNDKLLYIAPPIFKDGIPNPVKTRIELVKKKQNYLSIERIGHQAPETIRKSITTKRNELRTLNGMAPLRAGTKFVGDTEIQMKPGEAIVTGIREDEDFTRLNLNGGDSWAYWHFNDSFEIIRCFKNDMAFYTKELLPNYYADLVAARNVANAQPTATGDVILAFRDRRSAAYYNGKWNEGTQTLSLDKARSEVQLNHWMLSHGKQDFSGTFIPIWDMEYLPNENFIVDQDRRIINTFKPSEYMKRAKARAVDLDAECPLIKKVIFHLVGSDQRVYDEFINWFACFFQRIGKPITCWTFHGIEGTGKGTFFNYIAKPLLHPSNVINIGIKEAQDNFNGFLKNKLLVFNDEIDVDAFTEKGLVTAQYRKYITDPTVTVREMGVMSHEVPNTFGLIFASNQKQPVWVPPSDRRYNIGIFQRKKLDFNEEDIKNIEKELQAFADYLTAYKASIDRASQIVDTADRRRIAKLAVTSLQETANALVEGDLERLWAAMPDESHLSEVNAMSEHMAYASAYATLVRRITTDFLTGENTYRRLSRDEIRTIFQYSVGNTAATPNKFTSSLSHLGIELHRMKRNGKNITGMEVMWSVTKEFRGTLEEEFANSKQKPKLRKVV